MRFYKLLLRNTRPPFEGIDVLRETGPQKTFRLQQAYERMGNGWPVFAWI